MKRIIMFLVLGAAAISVLAGLKPKEGFVPDAATAIKIALAVWEPIYGTNAVTNEKPYRAKLFTNTVWRVEGSLPPDSIGGVMTAWIAKQDGKILDVYHTR
jgi:hypothetical protein